MALAIRKGAYGSGTTGCTIAMPTGGNAPVAGEVGLIVLESSDSTTAAGTPSTPANWTKIFERTEGDGATGVTTLTIFGRILAGADADVAITGVGNHCSGSVAVVSGHGASVIGDVVVGTGAGNAAGTDGAPPSITVTAGSLILFCVGSTRDTDSSTQFSNWSCSDPSSLTEIEDNVVSTAAGGGIGYAWGICAGTTTGIGNVTITSAIHNEVLLGIPPLVVNGTASPATVAGAGGVPAVTARGASIASPAAVAGTGAVPSPTASGGASAAPATVAGIGAQPAVTGKGNSSTTPDAVAGVGGVPAVTAQGASIASPSAVVGVGAVPAVASTGTGVASPAAVAGVGAIPAVSGAGATNASPGVVAGVGAIPQVQGKGDAVVIPVTVGGVGNVPAPVARGAAVASPGTVGAIGDVPAVSTTAVAIASPSVVAGVGLVPAVTGKGTGVASPSAVAGTGNVPAAIGRGGGIASPATVAGIGAVPPVLAFATSAIKLIVRTLDFVKRSIGLRHSSTPPTVSDS